RAALNAAATDAERLAAMLALAKSIIDNDPREVLALGTDSLALAERLGDEHRMAEGLRRMGQMNWRLGNYQQSLELLERAHGLSERLGDMAGVAKAIGEIGTV